MSKPAGPNIDTKGGNGKTDKCAETVKLVNCKIGKMVKPTGAKIGTNGNAGKTVMCAKMVKLVKW